MPLAFTPPKGVGRWRTFSEFTQIIPASKLVCKSQSAGQVIGPHIAGQAVRNVIGDLQSLFLGREGNRCQNRSKDFLLGDTHPVIGIGEQRRAHEVAFVAERHSPCRDGCAVLFGNVEIACHLPVVFLCDQRTDFGGRVKRMAYPDPVDARNELCFKFLTYRILHQETRRRGAALAIDRIDHEDHCIERAVQIGIVKDDDRILASQFKVIAFERVRTLPGDQAPGPAFADECDGLDQRVFDKAPCRPLRQSR